MKIFKNHTPTHNYTLLILTFTTSLTVTTTYKVYAGTNLTLWCIEVYNCQ